MDKVKEELLADFDFKKVARVMEFVGWKTYNEDGYGFPTPEQLKKTVSRLYDDLVANPKIISTGTAGFTVFYDSEIEKNDVIRIEFVLESALKYIGEE